MRGVLACIGDGLIIAQNRGQGVVVMVERGCDAPHWSGLKGNSPDTSAS
jgi:hypothetical protein